jgi:hypothetical protein
VEARRYQKEIHVEGKFDADGKYNQLACILLTDGKYVAKQLGFPGVVTWDANAEGVSNQRYPR